MIIVLKVIGTILFLAFAGMCMWQTLSHAFNWGNKDNKW